VLRRVRSSPWTGFLVRRLFSLAIILIGLVLATFLMVRLTPGDPAVNVGGISATPDDLARIRTALGLDRPMHEQFVVYMQNLARGDLGQSFFTRQAVTTVISQRVGTSLQLAASALAVVLLISIPAGILIGALTREGRHKRGELAYTGFTSILGALPEFLAATFLAFIFAVWLRVLPVAGGEGPVALVLPVASVALRPIAILSRIVRVETLNVLAMDYLRTARGKRLPARLLYLRHTLPNVLTAALTIGGLLFAGLVGGAVVVENVFARAGLGTALVTAVLQRDYPVVQGIVLVL
jgi:peptide/nickel transport system permease protein